MPYPCAKREKRYDDYDFNLSLIFLSNKPHILRILSVNRRLNINF